MRCLLKRSRYLYSNISLKFEANHAAFVTLSNEKKRNPLSLETINQLGSALREVQSKIQQHRLKILILKGDGPVFSAGHDLKELKASKEPINIFAQCTKNLLLLRRLPIITLCAVNGVVAAGGFQLALTCDMIIATQKSTFSTPGVKWGLFCSTPGVQLIRTISSEKKAREMLLFGEPISAAEAYHYGLINKVVKAEQLDEQVNSYIAKAGNLSGEVIALGKRVFDEQSKLDLENAYCVAEKAMGENITTKSDCQEGLTAFAQKRHPHFKN